MKDTMKNKMKWLIGIGMAALVVCAVGAYADTATNDPTAGVTLTPDQMAKVDNAITQLVPLIPVKYQATVAGAILMLTVASKLGRVIVGWKAGGPWGAIKAVFVGSAAAAKLLLCLALPALMLTGCKIYQVVEATSGSGANISAAVPIPYSGGQSLLGVKLIAGTWKTGTIVQPTGTNAMTSPSVAIRQGTTGNANVAGQAVITATNGVATVGATGFDQTEILTGTATDTNSIGSLTTGKQ